ncbi:MAG: TIGR02206 family membrane protein [Candidatus Marinimicrobia bacterium]|nr:TIGR02206 family membrane protein [Candidatus Neomarinimicrobiota bacterium]
MNNSIVRETVLNYLTNYEPFRTFDIYHTISLVIFLGLATLLPLYAKRNFSEKWQQWVGSTLGWLVAASYLSWPTLEIIAGTFDPKLHLPFHLCRFANLALPLVMWKRNYLVYEVLYFWGLSAMFQSIFTPDIPQAFPHYHFFRFWISHELMIVALVYATVIYKIRPTLKSLRRSFVALLLFFIITIPVNLILGANYFWICGKPLMPTILDYMGPWPWYLVTGTAVALIHFYAVYLPFVIIDWRKKNRIG